MGKYLVRSNELYLIDQERVHQAAEQIVGPLSMTVGSTFGSDLYEVIETYFKDLDKRREINHLLGITGSTYDPTEDFRIC